MLKRFFILCSGSDTDILEHCSKGEQNKYAGIGATVFFTALLAFIASSYALYTVFDNLLTAIIFGFIWGLLIFNLDRYIVSTLKKRGSFIDEFLQAVPRIILALIIAVVISKPLELKIFEKEIDQVLLEQKNDLTLANKDQIALQYTPQIQALTTNIDKLKNEIVIKETEVNALYDVYIGEAEGTAGTNRLGKGPVYKEKRDKHDTALAELQQLKIDNAEKTTVIESQIAQLQTEVNALYDVYIGEADGTTGTNRLGKGPVYKEKRDKHDAALAELQQLKIDNAEKTTVIESQIAQLQTEYTNEVDTTQPIIDGFDGLMARVNALGELPWLPSFFIFLLFLAIETSPIFAKLLSPKGEYDIKLIESEEELKIWAQQNAHQRSVLLNTDNTLNDRVYEDINDDDELYNYKKKVASDVLKLQADAFYKRQKRLL